MPAFLSWAFTECHHHSNWGSRHSVAAHYSFIDPERMKGWVVGVSQTLRRWTEDATYIWQGGHHVGHRPTFLVYLWNLVPGTGTRVSGPEPLPEYPVNVAIPTGKVWEFMWSGKWSPWPLWLFSRCPWGPGLADPPLLSSCTCFPGEFSV